jgi:site-specific recombinase XerD
VFLSTGAHVTCTGKGRKQRITPLTPVTAKVLAAWLAEDPGNPDDPLFPSRSGTPMSRDAVERRLAKHAAAAAVAQPSLKGKKISPHVMRHTAAMRLLAAGIDTTVIALWLGHESVATTQIYIHADLAIKEKALARTAPLDIQARRFQPPDALMAFLESL